MTKSCGYQSVNPTNIETLWLGEVGLVRRMIKDVTMIYLCRRKVRRNDSRNTRPNNRSRVLA